MGESSRSSSEGSSDKVQRETVDGAGARRLSIVLVDDSSELRDLVRMRLELSKRFEVVGEGGSGADAIRVVTDLDPDVVLLDVSMPGMDGLEALARLHVVAPRTRVVMFTGFEEQGLADRARELGAADFIVKSTPFEQLMDRVAAAVTTGPSGALEETSQAALEPVIQEHLERFRAAFDQAAIGMATLTLTGRIVRCNTALESVVGAGPGALIGVPYEGLSEPETAEAFEAVVSGGRDVATVEHRLHNGSVVVSTLAGVRDSAEAPLYVFLQVQEVTERRAAEEELRRSEERFRVLVESVQDYAIFMLDPSGHIISWNTGAERAKGYRSDEIIGRHFSIFYLEEAIERDHPSYELDVARRDGRYEEEGWRVRKDGTTFWANVVITPICDGAGNHIGYAKVTRDVTERHQLLEELEAAAASRTQMLAMTAHELRSPVAVTKGLVSTLLNRSSEFADQTHMEMLRVVDRQTMRLSRLVEDLFTVARLECGAFEVRTTRVDLLAIVQEAVEDVGGCDISVIGSSTTVLADRARVHQMVANYLSNAQRYGAAPITVTVADEGGLGKVEVADAGAGVDEDLRSRLFDKFSNGGAHGGTGLGLFIVRELARAQGGDAWYEPGSARGAAFSLGLPLADD